MLPLLRAACSVYMCACILEYRQTSLCSRLANEKTASLNVFAGYTDAPLRAACLFVGVGVVGYFLSSMDRYNRLTTSGKKLRSRVRVCARIHVVLHKANSKPDISCNVGT